MKHILRFCLVFCVFLLFVAVFNVSSVALGQERVGAKVQPAFIDGPEARIDPGSSKNYVLKVTNLDSEEKTYSIVTRDIKGLSESGDPVFADPEEDILAGISLWVRTNKKILTVGPGGTGEVLATISVPSDASPGGHFGGVFFVVGAKSLSETGSGVGYEIGTLINLRIAGEIKEEARIREFSSEKMIYGSPNVLFSTRVENLGNVLVRPRGPVEITSMFGKKKKTIVMNDERSGVFPGQERSFESRWEGDGFSFGRYQATISLAYGEEVSRTISSSIAFWVLPLKTILPVFGGLVAIILLVAFSFKIYLKRRIKEFEQAGAIQGGSVLGRGEARTPFSRLLFVTLGVMFFVLVLFLLLFVFFG
ncbi:MAG: hypothetical protein AAB495_03340 [Patescibacteria group bacterium]